MRFFLSAFVALFLLSGAVKAADLKQSIDPNAESVITTVVDSSTKMVTAFATGNEEQFLSYAYMPAIELAGGKEKLLKEWRDARKEMAKAEMRVVSAVTDKPAKVVIAGDQWHTMIKQTVLMSVKDDVADIQSYLMGISDDQGKTWKFMDSAVLRDTAVKKILFPSYNEELAVPDPAPAMPAVK